MHKTLILSLLLALLAVPASADVLIKAQKQKKDKQAEIDIERKIELFELYTFCSPLYLVVFELPEEGAKATGLTREAIENRVESRLRSARIYSEEPYDSRLYVLVNIVGAAFSIEIGLLKGLNDPKSDHFHGAITWRSGSTGTYGTDGNYILSSVSKHLDKFIAEYLRVNEKDCK